ncbi:hypothetical protein B296_00039207 [Ensete ventricosum]|uniref:Ubiquitin-like domain-containing protein n=1 Tax=Ensete ventricosum TaxID=4639 RepID=A0A426YK41_ENSVE|nr:hypothetical protein B296_00039207 [Ensete ventricosum]
MKKFDDRFRDFDNFQVFLFFFFFSQLFQDSTSDVGLQLWLHVRCSSLTSLISWGRNANAAEKEAAFALAALMEVPHPTQSDGGARHSRGSEGRSAEETWRVAAGWEMRPGGLLVQQRSPVPGKPPPPQVRVRISHGAARYVVSVSSIATFGELKKLLTADSGLQPAEQRMLYKGKQRGDSEYLDACGVKNRSKIVLVEDSTSLERRYTEIRKNARMQSAHRAVSTISLEVDKLADQVQQPHPLEFCVMY